MNERIYYNLPFFAKTLRRRQKLKDIFTAFTSFYIMKIFGRLRKNLFLIIILVCLQRIFKGDIALS